MQFKPYIPKHIHISTSQYIQVLTTTSFLTGKTKQVPLTQ